MDYFVVKFVLRWMFESNMRMRDGFIRDSLGPLQNSAGAQPSDTDITSILNNHLASVFANEDTNNIPEIELYKEP